MTLKKPIPKTQKCLQLKKHLYKNTVNQNLIYFDPELLQMINTKQITLDRVMSKGLQSSAGLRTQEERVDADLL